MICMFDNRFRIALVSAAVALSAVLVGFGGPASGATVQPPRTQVDCAETDPDQDLDGIPDLCDNCPTIPNPDRDPCACAFCGAEEITISFQSPLGKGSGVVGWVTLFETDIRGFNVVQIDNRGNRTQINDVIIPCLECTTGQDARYASIIPKHKSGRGIFVELIRLGGEAELFGPARRVR